MFGGFKMRVFAMGYSGTGSSAIVHLINEYKNCQNSFNKTFEHILFYTPHGLFDLEDSILRSNTILRSDAAINDFYKAMKRLNDNDFGWCGGYKKRYGNKFMDIVESFISSLVEYSRKGGWDYDYTLVKDHVKIRTKIGYFVRKFILRQDVKYPTGLRYEVLGDDGVINYCFDSPEEFYSKARKFVDDYFELIGYNKESVIVIDQIVQPQHLFRFLNYSYEDDRFIILRRDVRDMYIYGKYIWRKDYEGAFYTSNPVDFCKFYRRFLSTEKIVDDPKVLRINFEDLIYKYEDTLKIIETFIGIDKLGNHEFKGRFFNPEISINNTQIFRLKDEWVKEVQPIELNMKDRLYNFPFEHKTSVDKVIDPHPVIAK